jgi:hypothetical protein
MASVIIATTHHERALTGMEVEGEVSAAVLEGPCVTDGWLSGWVVRVDSPS